MSDKSPQEQATLGFSLLLGYAAFALCIQVLNLAFGRMAWTASDELGFVVVSVQIAGLCLVYRWSKEHRAAGPLTVLGVGAVLFIFSNFVHSMAPRSNAGIALLLFVSSITCLVCVFSWLHRLYLSLDRDDLLKLEKWMVYLFVLMVAINLLPPSVQAGLPTLFSSLFVGYFVYVFLELRKETLNKP